MVVLCLATGIGGIFAALLDLPHTLGFILGGMLVGPSCLDIIERVVQVLVLLLLLVWLLLLLICCWCLKRSCGDVGMEGFHLHICLSSQSKKKKHIYKQFSRDI
jgi:hypothetical protein